jgi:Glycerol uptake facilitator and related permeases (Major Intrinsic Protein Family)
MKKFVAELIGTFALVLFGCGSAVFGQIFVGSDSLTTVGNPITITAIGLCFGLAVLIMAYALGPISGCHVNPAVSLGVYLNKGMSLKDMLMYWVAQFIGATLGAVAVGAISQQWAAFGSNQFAEEHLSGAFIGEVLFTFLFLIVILGATSSKAPKGFAGIAIGWALAIINIVMIPIDGASVNPARSFGPAILQGGECLSQLWVFIVAPLIGAALAALVWKIFKTDEVAEA